ISILIIKQNHTSLLFPYTTLFRSMLVMALSFVIEISVVRHYGFATIFITPLTILLAEAVTFDRSLSTALIQARFFATVLGCVVRSEEHTSELQSRENLVCRLMLEK